jgi:folylpolyglutamate synthase/dihydrofolate synthase
VTPRAVPTLTYHELVAELFPRLTGGIRWGLERTQRILAGAGDPHRRYGVLHVGGTNGKGSVAAHIEAVLRAQGHRTGLYTSPHLCTFRERIRIGGRAVGEAELLAAAGRVWPAIVAEGASFFEATTAIAFVALADAEVDVAIVEVGLGGRLDATNVVDPDVVVLTNVSLDHIQLLGNTLPAVAREKAGIIKPGVPVVTAEPDGAALAVFRATAAAAAARLVELDAAAVADVELSSTATRFTLHGTGWGDVRLATPLAGAHQVVNAALAALALDATPRWRPDRDSLVAGLAATRWPGRLQLERVAGRHVGIRCGTQRRWCSGTGRRAPHARAAASAVHGRWRARRQGLGRHAGAAARRQRPRPADLTAHRARGPTLGPGTRACGRAIAGRGDRDAVRGGARSRTRSGPGRRRDRARDGLVPHRRRRAHRARSVSRRQRRERAGTGVHAMSHTAPCPSVRPPSKFAR